MEKFMKITIGIVAKLAFFAIVCATAYGVAHLWDTTGLVVLLGVVLLGWIISGFIPDKQALAYAEMQFELAVKDGEVQRLQKEVTGAEAAAAKWQSEYNKKCAELEEQTKMYRESANIIHEEKAQFKHAWEEATKREEMLHKQLREKQGKVEYWRSRYNALKSEAEARKADEDVFVSTDLSADKDVEREATVEVPLVEAEVEEVEAESVEVAVAPAPNYPRRHKIKRQSPKPARS